MFVNLCFQVQWPMTAHMWTMTDEMDTDFYVAERTGLNL